MQQFIYNNIRVFYQDEKLYYALSDLYTKAKYERRMASRGKELVDSKKS